MSSFSSSGCRTHVVLPAARTLTAECKSEPPFILPDQKLSYPEQKENQHEIFCDQCFAPESQTDTSLPTIYCLVCAHRNISAEAKQIMFPNTSF